MNSNSQEGRLSSNVTKTNEGGGGQLRDQAVTVPAVAAMDEAVLVGLAGCGWRDRTLWAARQLFGGNSHNGFFKATATVQRIKRQRTRQTNSTKARQQQREAAAKQAADNSNCTSTSHTTSSFQNATEKIGPLQSQDDVSIESSNENNASKARKLNGTVVASESAAALPFGGNNGEDDEELKSQVMNPRTAKKLKLEMEGGMKYCEVIHNVLSGALKELHPDALTLAGLTVPPPLGDGIGLPDTNSFMDPGQSKEVFPLPGALVNVGIPMQSPERNATNSSSSHQIQRSLTAEQIATSNKTTPLPVPIAGVARPFNVTSTGRMIASNRVRMGNSVAGISNGNKSNIPPTQSQTSKRALLLQKMLAPPKNPTSNSKTTTLRKNRKKKLLPSGEPTIEIPEFDANGKRLCSRKDHIAKILEILQYRALRQGDPVAAKPSSRDLWILARVVRDHAGAGANMTPSEILQLNPTKRAQLFGDKVMVLDVEDNDSAGASPIAVPRNAILPLPRNCSEAAEWCAQFYRKGSRVFAMYPDTTSLYSATVIDATSYCQDNDDIVVVRFDEDEPDEMGATQKCHIPSRFVTPMPPSMISAVAAINKKRNLTKNRNTIKGKKGSAPASVAKTSTFVGPPAGQSQPLNMALDDASIGTLGNSECFDLGLGG